MDSQDLRALQAPIKEKYREEPSSAIVTLEARATLGDAEGLSCSVATGRGLVKAGLHPATGGDGTLVCSGDMLLQALVACAGVTLRAVATSTAIPLTDATISAFGDIDFRGTLGVDREAPVGFKNIALRFELMGDLSPEQVATLQKLTERYCVVFQTLAAGVRPSAHFSVSAPTE